MSGVGNLLQRVLEKNIRIICCDTVSNYIFQLSASLASPRLLTFTFSVFCPVLRPGPGSSGLLHHPATVLSHPLTCSEVLTRLYHCLTKAVRSLHNLSQCNPRYLYCLFNGVQKGHMGCTNFHVKLTRLYGNDNIQPISAYLQYLQYLEPCRYLLRCLPGPCSSLLSNNSGSRSGEATRTEVGRRRGGGAAAGGQEMVMTDPLDRR